jgi:hypothetical protein
MRSNDHPAALGYDQIQGIPMPKIENTRTELVRPGKYEDDGNFALPCESTLPGQPSRTPFLSAVIEAI